MENDSDPFGFNSLTYITRQEDSKALNDYKKPCIIISASGMMEAGRIKHHLANNISNPQNTILVVGYCSPVTLGARIARGDKEVSIFGTVYKVNAEVKKIDSFSGHGDYKEMISFLSCQNMSQLQRTFLVHGEYETQINYSARLQEAGFTQYPDSLNATGIHTYKVPRYGGTRFGEELFDGFDFLAPRTSTPAPFLSYVFLKFFPDLLPIGIYLR